MYNNINGFSYGIYNLKFVFVYHQFWTEIFVWNLMEFFFMKFLIWWCVTELFRLLDFLVSTFKHKWKAGNVITLLTSNRVCKVNFQCKNGWQGRGCLAGGLLIAWYLKNEYRSLQWYFLNDFLAPNSLSFLKRCSNC